MKNNKVVELQGKIDALDRRIAEREKLDKDKRKAEIDFLIF